MSAESVPSGCNVRCKASSLSISLYCDPYLKVPCSPFRLRVLRLLLHSYKTIRLKSGADVSMSEADPGRRQSNGAGPSQPTGTSSLEGQNGLSQQAGSVPNGHSIPHVVGQQPELASSHLPHAPPLGKQLLVSVCCLSC